MKVVFGNLANFLSISPNQTPVFAVCLPGPRWTFLLFLFLLILYSLPYMYTLYDVHEAGSLKKNTALEYSTRVVQEGGRRCKKRTLNDLVHLTPHRIPLMNPPMFSHLHIQYSIGGFIKDEYCS